MMYKGYDIRWNKFSPMNIEIGVGENKGRIPDALSGLYTSRTIAMQAIDTHLSTKKVKDKSNGETDAESGSK